MAKKSKKQNIFGVMRMGIFRGEKKTFIRVHAHAHSVDSGVMRGYGKIFYRKLKKLSLKKKFGHKWLWKSLKNKLMIQNT